MQKLIFSKTYFLFPAHPMINHPMKNVVPTHLPAQKAHIACGGLERKTSIIRGKILAHLSGALPEATVPSRPHPPQAQQPALLGFTVHRAQAFPALVGKVSVARDQATRFQKSALGEIRTRHLP